MLKLYQIQTSSEDRRRANAGERVPSVEAARDAMCFGECPGRDFYSHVADLHTSELEDAFRIGNIGPESEITRHAPMHSVSVGDVLVDEAGTAHIVASFGFNTVEGWA